MPSAINLLRALSLSLALVFGVVILSSNAPAYAQQFKTYWPPQLNNYYPEVELMSLSGRKVKLSSFAGRVLLIEPVGMSCPACQAFVGASARGGYDGVTPQPGMRSIDQLLTENGISPSDSRLVRVQLLLYSMKMGAPSLQEAQAWAKHFGFGQRSNEVVLIGDSRYVNSASYDMIPGFQLVDRRFVLRSDSTGHQPKNDLYKELLPLLKSTL